MNMKVEYEGMADDYTIPPVDDPEGIWSFCKFIMGPAKAAIFSRPEFAHTSEQHIVCGNKNFNGYQDSATAAGTFAIWFTVVESRLNEVEGMLEDISCRKTSDCTSAVLRGRLLNGATPHVERHSPRLPGSRTCLGMLWLWAALRSWERLSILVVCCRSPRHRR